MLPRRNTLQAEVLLRTLQQKYKYGHQILSVVLRSYYLFDGNMEIQNCMSLISTSIEKVLQCITQLNCWLLGKVIVGFCVPSRSTWFITFNYAAKRRVCRTTLLMLRRGRSFIGVDINVRNQRDQEKTLIKIARELATIGDEIYSKCMQLKSQ